MIPWSLWVLVGCRTDDAESGVAVGNPGTLKMTLATAREDVEIMEAAADFAELDVVACDGAATATTLATDLALGGTVALEEGVVCTVTLRFGEGGLSFAAQGPIGGVALVDLAIDQITLRSPGFVVDEDAYILELGEPDWIGAAALGVAESEGEVTIGPESGIHDLIVGTIQATSSIYRDSDGSGAIDGERESGPVAGGSGRDDVVGDEVEEGPNGHVGTDGCGNVQGSLVLLGFGALFGRRRRR